MKQCTKCGEWREKKYFDKDKKRKDELQPWCKDCKKEYRENNKEKIKEWRKSNENYWKEYQQNNKDKISKINKKWHENNKEKAKEYRNSPIPFDSTAKLRKEIELYEEIKESKNGNVMCKCAYCGSWFETPRSQIQNRVDAANSVSLGEQRLYCKDECKQACPTYNQSLYPKDMKPDTAREVQPELRQMVFKRDNYTCQRCNTHKDNLEVELHCHHIEGIQHEPLQSADTDMCITFCADCHKKVHKTPGCDYHDMQCKEPEIIYNYPTI